MDNLNPVGWINSPSEIKEKILQAINSPHSIGLDRKVWLNKIVQSSQKNTSLRIAGLLAAALDS